MSITVTSTTDSKEVLDAVNSDETSEPKVDETKSAEGEKPEEKPEESDDSEKEENETDDSADSDADETSEDEKLEAQAKDQPKKKGGFKRRIDKLTSKLSAAEQEREYWRQEALKHAQKPEAEKESKPERVETTNHEPNPDDFETSTEFYRAHAKWAAKEEILAAKELDRQEKMRSEAESKKTTFHGKVEDFKKAHDDFEDVISDVDDIMMSPAISQIILESDNGPELMYELAKNRDVYAEMCAMSPFEAVRAFGRFEAKFISKSSEQKTKPEIKTTKAPKPINPVASSATGSVKKSIDDPNISQREFERLREAQIAKQANY